MQYTVMDVVITKLLFTYSARCSTVPKVHSIHQSPRLCCHFKMDVLIATIVFTTIPMGTHVVGSF